MKITFRIWVGGLLIATDVHDSDEEGFNLAQLRQRHEQTVEASDDPWMIEIEVHGGPPDERFFRFGTDAELMRDPQPYARASHRNHPWSPG